MRYLPIAKLCPGMVTGQDIFDGEGTMLLEKGNGLDDGKIRELDGYGFPGVYIDDAFTSGIGTEQILKPETRRHALNMVHGLFLKKEHSPEEEEEELRGLVMDMIHDILGSGDVMYDIVDLKNYDDYDYFNAVNVAVLSAVLGVHLGLSEYELKILTTAALLHDLGKKFVKGDVLNAKRSLTEEEKRLVLQHPKLGYEFVRRNYDFEEEVGEGILGHHEWYNGEGYPLRRSGGDISVYARIIKMADVYDAMTARRPFRDALAPSDAMEYITANRESEFDPKIVDVFLKWVAVYPVGCEVELSDGRRAVVAENSPEELLRPRIKILESGEEIDLRTDEAAKGLSVEKISL